MSDELQNSVSDANGSGSTANDQTVSYESHQRAIAQLKKAQAQAKELQQQFNEMKAENEAAKAAQLAEDEKYKELHELSLKKAQEAEEKLNLLQREQLLTRKKESVVAHIGAVKKPEYLTFLKLDEVDLDDPESVLTEANRFKSTYPEVLASSATPTHTGDSPGDAIPDNKKPTSEWSDAQLDAAFSIRKTER